MNTTKDPNLSSATHENGAKADKSSLNICKLHIDNNVQSTKTNPICRYDSNDKLFDTNLGSKTTVDFDVSLSSSLASFNCHFVFYGSMSRVVLESFLSRSLHMQGMSDPSVPTSWRIDDHRMIHNVGAKYIGRMLSQWGIPTPKRFSDTLARLKEDTGYLHKHDCNIICECAILEYNKEDDPQKPHTIPSYVKSDLSTSEDLYILPHKVRDDLIDSLDDLVFIQSKMLYYPTDVIDNGINRSYTPNISRGHTLMWFYYQATQYILNGCEALHFGQVQIMNETDPGNRSYWWLLEKIRAFARINARRKLVLCNAHIPEGSPYYDPVRSRGSSPPPAWERQLLFDFHAGLITITQNFRRIEFCNINYQPIILNTDKESPYNRKRQGLINLSAGGRNPLGWLCKENPYFLEFDNYGSDKPRPVGCDAPRDEDGGWDIYGWDIICYLATQSEYWRNKILIYLHYKLRCLDNKGYIQMPGRRNIVIPNQVPFSNSGYFPPVGYHSYRANMGSQNNFCFNQEDTIKKIWSGVYAGNVGWQQHDFAKDNIFVNTLPNASSDLLFVGDNQMYYIGIDGYIYGYVNYNGVWLTVSPSYWADGYYGTRVSTQVKAATGLVASPSGNRLLFIGIDGLLYWFDVLSIWDYKYMGEWMSSEMSTLGVIAVSGLTFPTPTTIYFIGRFADSTRSVFVFENVYPSWRLVRLASSARRNYGRSIFSQRQPSGKLTYDTYVYPNRIFYTDSGGLVAYYLVIGYDNYDYADFSHNHLLLAANIQVGGNLVLSGGDKIYFAGRKSSLTHQIWIYCFVFTTSGWILTSPSSNNTLTLSSQISCEPYGTLAVSPDGKTITYFGRDSSFLCFLRKNTDGTFTFHKTSINNPIDFGWKTSLQFGDNSNIYYVSYFTKKVQQFIYEELVCSNSIINEIE